MLLETMFGALLELWPLASDRRRDRRLLREGRARCGLRSVTGRVADIGTEWSVGTCVISTGRIRFTPRIGIVGDRDIEVLEVLSGHADLHEEADLGLGEILTYVIRTSAGDLLWALPGYVAENASALLFGE